MMVSSSKIELSYGQQNTHELIETCWYLRYTCARLCLYASHIVNMSIIRNERGIGVYIELNTKGKL